MAQLVGVDDGPDRMHQAIGDVEGEDVDDPAVGVVADRPGLAVDPGQLDTDPQRRSPAVQPEQEPGDPVPSVDGLGHRPRLAAAVADHDHVGREQVEQAVQVAAGGRLEEPAGHLVALPAGGLEAGFLVADVLPGPGEYLAAVRLGLAGDVRDLGVPVAEHLV